MIQAFWLRQRDAFIGKYTDDKTPFCALDKLVCDTDSNRFLILCISLEQRHKWHSYFFRNSRTFCFVIISSQLKLVRYRPLLIQQIIRNDSQVLWQAALQSVLSDKEQQKLRRMNLENVTSTLLVLIITVDVKYSKTESTRTWPHYHIIYSRSISLNLQSKWQLRAGSPTSTDFHRILDMYVPFGVLVVVTMNITVLRDKLPLLWFRRNLQLPSFSLNVPEMYSDPLTVWIFCTTLSHCSISCKTISTAFK